MRRALALAALAAAAFAGASACSLATQFDPEGQPCDAARLCLLDAGYRCVEGLCTRREAPDAGP